MKSNVNRSIHFVGARALRRTIACECGTMQLSSCRDQDLYAGTIHMPFGKWRVRGINMDVRRQPRLFGRFGRG